MLKSDAIVGAAWVTLAMFFLAGLVTLGRYVALTGLDPFQVLFFRNLFCVVWMLPLFYWRGPALANTDQLPLYGWRVGLSFIAMAGMFHAVAVLPVGEVTAIGFLAPLFATLAAIVLLGEQVGVRRWCGLLVGFLGAMTMLVPELFGLAGRSFGEGQIFAIISACAVGVVGPLVKSLTRHDDPDKIVFLTNALVTPVSLVPALFVWVWPPLDLWPWLVAMGLVAVLGHMALVRGYAVMEASGVQPFKFVRLPFAIVLGYFA
ncbi:MAG: DMT family transporter, partial [Pseudomonadota bacterium]